MVEKQSGHYYIKILRTDKEGELRPIISWVFAKTMGSKGNLQLAIHQNKMVL